MKVVLLSLVVWSSIGCSSPIVSVDAGVDAGAAPDAPAVDAPGAVDAPIAMDVPSGTDAPAELDAPSGTDAPEPIDAAGATDSGPPPCSAGEVRLGGVCTAIPAPRPIAPLSTSTAASRRPTFVWDLTAPATGAHVEICEDRACATIVDAFDVDGEMGSPTAPLPAGLSYWRLRGRSGGVDGIAASASWPVYLLARTGVTSTAWGSTPDYDGDGHADLAGAGYAAGAGAVFVYRGSGTGSILPATPSRRLDSPGGASSSFGYSMCSGDVNGDGYADLAVGAYGAFGSQGRVFVYFGGTTGLGGAPSVTLTSTAGGLGENVECAGDLNGDGYADVAAGHGAAAPRTVDLYFGSPDGPPTSPSQSLAGTALYFSDVVQMGDVNGDRFADLFVAAGFHADAYVGAGTYVYYGAASFPTTSALVTTSYGSAGYSRLAHVGDLNGDGFGDLVVSGYHPPTGGSDIGRFHVHLGGGAGITAAPTTNFASLPPGVSEGFGSTVAAAGDVNGDGFMDVAIGAELAPESGAGRNGAAWIYFGTGSGLAATPGVAYSGPDGTNAYYGGYIAGGGDVDGDGYADVAIGSLGGGGYAGRIRLYRGGLGGTSATEVWTANAPDGSGSFFTVPLL